jgi:hypothetical protein|tara:strand:- start:343 stop:852 length:510 start_codon:yes stop_codon:yes gene_type:complete
MSFTGFQLGLTDSLIEASKKVVENSAEYKKFFDGALKKFGVTSPAELTGDKKKEFFDYIDKNYNSDDEKGKDGVKEAAIEEKNCGCGKTPCETYGENTEEGKLPPALQKHIDKKKGKDDEDEKEVEEAEKIKYRGNLKDLKNSKDEEKDDEEMEETPKPSKKFLKARYS